MTCTLNSLRNATLEFQRSTCDATGKQFTLLVQEFLEEFRILIVDILDTVLFEAAIFLFLDINRGRCQISDF